jgi:peptidoglycan hydrolase-like protein with peptidoglycan-binding domain
METIQAGCHGAAVEDVQERLRRLGFAIAQEELAAHTFGPSTSAAVSAFRAKQGLAPGEMVDDTCWVTLVDEGYHMGDRTLYLRLPNFSGNDVRTLQNALNTLGFSCGAADGTFGVHTEAAVKQFQENVGLFADGMAFQDTFAAIWRLHHVWEGKDGSASCPAEPVGFARAAEVLETTSIALIATDPIARAIAGRMWNVASATSDASGLYLAASASELLPGTALVLLLSSEELPAEEGLPRVQMEDDEDLPQRLTVAAQAAATTPITLAIDLPFGALPQGSFTTNTAQTAAVRLLDALCTALASGQFWR